MSERIWEEPDRSIVAVDVVVFTVVDMDLKVLLITRDHDPFINMPTIIGCYMKRDETPENAVMRALKKKTGVENIELYTEQLYTFGGFHRDPRERIISIAYYALVNAKTLHFDPTKAQLVSVKALPSLGFDHNDIVAYAIQRLRWKMEYTTVAFSLLPERFTLTALHQIYEIILDKRLDKRNFRKKILSLGIIQPTSIKETGVGHKPAMYYTFTQQFGKIINLF